MRHAFFGLRGQRRVGARQRSTRQRSAFVNEPLEPRLLLATVSGNVFNDANGNGVIDGIGGRLSETPLIGWTVYEDLNNDGIHDRTEPTALTDGSGHYTLGVNALLFPTSLVIREVVPAGWRPTIPATGARGVRIASSSSNVIDQNFGDTQLIDVPTDLIALPRAAGVRLVFTDNSTNETEFVVERRLAGDPDSAFAEVARVATGSTSDTGRRVVATDATAVPGTAYAYRVRGSDAAGADPRASAIATVTAGSPGGTGVRATYYNDEYFTGDSVTLPNPAGADEFFDAGSPDPAIDPDTFSGTFTGFLQAEVSEPYAFFTASDDGIDFTLSDPDTGQVLLSGPPDGIHVFRGMPQTGFEDALGTVPLTAGKRYPVTWHMSENGGQAGYRVGWASFSTPMEVLPTELLFPSQLVANPSDLAGAGRADGVHLALTDNSNNETQFIIERRVSGQGDTPFTQVAHVASTTSALTGNRVGVTDPTALSGQLYDYRVRASAPLLGDSEPSGIATVRAGAVGGSGVRATYYNEEFFTGAPITLDAPVDADEFFGGGSPDPRIDPDTFSGVFSGFLQPEFSQPYTFYTTSDDGIDFQLTDPDTGQVLLQGPPNGINVQRAMPTTGFSFSTDTLGPVALTAGKRYPIQWRMSENLGGAGYRVGWSGPDTPQEVLPTDLLFPAPLVPRNAEAFSLCDNQVIVTFVDAAATETGFELQRADDPAGPFTTVATAPASPGVGQAVRMVDAASATNPLVPGKAYFYRVRAAGLDPSPFTQPSKVTVTEGGTRLTLRGDAVYLPGADGDVQTPADNLLRLTDNLGFQNSAAFTTAGWDLEKPGQGTGGAAGFNASFLFRIPAHSTPPADGFAFVVQPNTPRALGQPGSGLGYQGILNSFAVKFDFYPSLNQSGLYAGGAMDDKGTDLPFVLTDGSTFQVDLSYDAANHALTERLTNLSTPTAPPFQTTYTTAITPTGTATLDLGQMLGGPCAFVGFTGATGGATAVQLISGFTFDGQDIPLTGAAPSPKVTKVWVSGTGWSSQFKRSLSAAGVLDPYGYAVPASDSLHVLPWSNANQVSIGFSEDVQVDLADLKVGGVALSNYPIKSFGYDAEAHVATWTLGQAVRNDRLTLDLNADAPDGVKNVSEGVFLDGEWIPPGPGVVASFPSGNGVPGGDFKFGANVLAGDVNGDGTVNAQDLAEARRRSLMTRAQPGINWMFFDTNGDAVVNAIDLAWIRRQQHQVLPAVQPPPA